MLDRMWPDSEILGSVCLSPSPTSMMCGGLHHGASEIPVLVQVTAQWREERGGGRRTMNMAVSYTKAETEGPVSCVWGATSLSLHLHSRCLAIDTPVASLPFSKSCSNICGGHSPPETTEGGKL